MNTSRIPKPGSGIPSRLVQPAISLAVPAVAQKRPTSVSGTDGEAPASKRSKEEPALSTTTRPTSNLTKSRSMLNLAKPATVAKSSSTTATSRLLTSRRPLTTSNSVQPNASTSAFNRRAPLLPKVLGQSSKSNAGETVFESRMHAMEARLAELENVKVSSQGQITVLDTTNLKLEGALKDRDLLALSLQEQIEQLKARLRSETADKEALESKVKNLVHQLGILQRQKEGLEGEIQANLTEIRGLKNTVAELSAAEQGVKTRLEQTSLRLEVSEKKNEELENLKATLEAQVAFLNAKLMEEESIRRTLHNTIQELKGNIRVFCRIRPLLSFDNGATTSHLKTDQNTVEITKPAGESVNETMKSKNDKLEFTFDRVFGPESEQADVFGEISQLVQSALDGYNVCVFAYGQTGSGKTHTMEGGTTEGSEGMIPRTVELIFQRFEELKGKGWDYTVQASFLEIYNEQLRDLLGNQKDNLQHDIRAGEKGNEMIVTNLKVVDVTNAASVYRLLSQAQQQRAVAVTNCNERSSRSHSVFRLKIVGKNENTSESCQGTLHLVDLAGSERLKDSGSTGARLTETKNINKSLANLSNVILALANKNDHIPYRNSKLTHLLQCSLGGNSKTLMFVNVSPKDNCISETVNSLRFATKVSSCHIGTATKRITAEK